MATETTKPAPAPPDLLTLWALYLQERRRSLLTELRAVEAQQEQLKAWQGQPPPSGSKQQ